MSDEPVGTFTFTFDGDELPCEPGQTVLQAARAAGRYVPHLCFHPDFAPHGSCKVCTLELNGRQVTGCTAPVKPGDVVASETPALRALRTGLVQLLFTEGNHFCPSCEQSGACMLQAVGYELGVTDAHDAPFFSNRAVDASHPEVLLDFNRCILCELCVRASAEVDGKSVFAIAGRGPTKRLVVSAPSGRLGDTALHVDDKAVSVCPVGVILRKRTGFLVPIGRRKYDPAPISQTKDDDR